MRTMLLAAAATAALVVPLVAGGQGPRRPPAAPSAPEVPHVVARANVFAYNRLPFGCPDRWLCCWPPANELAILVQGDAVWVGAKAGSALRPPLRIPRDGHEWEVVVSILRELRRSSEAYQTIQLAVDDRLAYADLLQALFAADDAGVRVDIVRPALPVHPHHGWKG